MAANRKQQSRPEPLRVLLVDNYDSFTFNLYQYLCELGAKVTVRRNDAVGVADVRRMKPDRIVISPGPGRPEDAGNTPDIVRELAPTVPLLGVCLGHQTIGQVFGGHVVKAPRLMHGKVSPVRHNDRGVFAGLPQPVTVTRYHSLIVSADSLPDCLDVTAATDDGIIMGLRHRDYPTEGVQFHPESILTEAGKQLLQNFLDQSPGRDRKGAGRKKVKGEIQ